MSFPSCLSASAFVYHAWETRRLLYFRDTKSHVVRATIQHIQYKKVLKWKISHKNLDFLIRQSERNIQIFTLSAKLKIRHNRRGVRWLIKNCVLMVKIMFRWWCRKGLVFCFPSFIFVFQVNSFKAVVKILVMLLRYFERVTLWN